MSVWIVAYTWEADIHSIQATFDRFGEEPPEGYLEAGIHDREGNPPQPIFNTDDLSDPVPFTDQPRGGTL